MKRKGFTLAELMVALGVISIISTFSIAKVVTSYQASVKKAVLKEAYSVVSASFINASRQGFTSARDIVKATGDGISGASYAFFHPTYFGLPFYWIRLHSGVWIEIASYSNDQNAFFDIILDINDDSVGPNTVPIDRMHLIGVSARSSWGNPCGQPKGRLYAPGAGSGCEFWPYWSDNYQLYMSLFN